MLARLRRFRLRLAHALSPARAERDLAREVASHLALLEDELVRRGMTREAAYTEARKQFGGPETAKHQHRDARSFRWLDELFADLRQAWRTASRNKRSTVAAVVILTTVGTANALVFGLADAVLLRPLPYRDADRVFIVQMMNDATGQRSTRVGNEVLQVLKEPRYGLSRAGLLGDGPRIAVEGPEGPLAVTTASATPSYFEVLGVRPEAGRLFSDADAAASGHVALLSYDGWRTRFGGRADIVGTVQTLGNASLEIIGVLPPSVFLTTIFGEAPEVIVATPYPGAGDETAGAFHPVVRLDAGVTVEQAQTVLTTIARANHTGTGPASIPSLDPIRSVLFPAGTTIMRWLVACMLALVVLAGLHLAALFIARGFGRARDTGVRLALGASRTRILRPVCFEVLGISVAGGLASMVVATWAFDSLLELVPQIVYRNAPVGIDLRVGLITVGVLASASLASTLFASWFSTGREGDVLTRSAAGRRSSTSIWGRGQLLVVVQVALTVVLVFGAAITARAFVALLNIPLGFDPTNILHVSIRLRPGEPLAYERILQGIQSHPNVMTAGAVGIGQAPFEGGSPFDHVQTEEGRVFGGLRHALPGYLETLGLRLVQGRTLTWADDREAGDVAVLTESAAEALAPGGDALGRTFTNSRRNRILRVIGVISDLRHRTEVDPQPAVYALPQDLIRPLSLVIRTTHRSEDLLQRLRQVVRDEVPGGRVTATWYADSIWGTTTFRNPRFQTIVLTALSGVALVLTMVGIVGVVGNLVASRTRELAVRAAVGATPKGLVLMIAGQVALPVAAGVAIGLVGTRWASGFAEAQLFAVEATGVTALASTVAVVLAAALGAAIVPSRRAGRVDPVVALRAE